MEQMVTTFDPNIDCQYDDDMKNYPECVKIAVNWWLKAILSPEKNNLDQATICFYMRVSRKEKPCSYKEIDTFKKSLAERVNTDLLKYKKSMVSLLAEPCAIIANAGENKIPDVYFQFCLQPIMSVYEDKILVANSAAAPDKVYWSKK